MKSLSELQVLRAYARMINTHDASHLEPYLPDDLRYASQSVLGEITSKNEYIDYITSKLGTIKSSGSGVWAEIAKFDGLTWGHEYGVVLAQGDRNNLISTFFACIEPGVLRRMNMCIIPAPEAGARTGEYPGLDNE